MSSEGNSDKKARESFASILSYYLHNRDSIENVPGWTARPESGSIIIGLDTRSIPSDQQVEEEKDYLKSLLAMQETISKISSEELQLMNAAAFTSKAKRRWA